MSRYFEVVEILTKKYSPFAGIRVKGDTPRKAVAKVITALGKRYPKKLPKKVSVKLVLRESTRGSGDEEMMYKVTRKVKEEPKKTVFRSYDDEGNLVSEREVIHKYETIVTPM